MAQFAVKRFGKTIAKRTFYPTGQDSGYVIIDGKKWRVKKVHTKSGSTHLRWLGRKK